MARLCQYDSLPPIGLLLLKGYSFKALERLNYFQASTLPAYIFPCRPQGKVIIT